MKSNVMPSIVQIEAGKLQQLVAEVKETVATAAGIVDTRKTKNALTFGIVDLWNIRKGAKTSVLYKRR